MSYKPTVGLNGRSESMQLPSMSLKEIISRYGTLEARPISGKYGKVTTPNAMD